MAGKYFVLGLALLLLAGAVSAYTTHIDAPAVLTNSSAGELTGITLNVTSGTGQVNILGPSSVGQDTLASARTAVAYATSYMGVNSGNYNFNYTISTNTSISGPSAGLAFTLLAISALQHKQLYHSFSVTGTIESNGSVGLVGGVYDKAQAVKSNGLSYFLVPDSTGLPIYQTVYYLAQQEYNLPIMEVSNVSQALQLAFGSGTVKKVNFGTGTDYKVDSIPNVTASCNSCNVTAFGSLENFTVNATQDEMNGMGSNFSSARAGMLGQLDQYRVLASKGYLYVASDLSFLQFINASVFDNVNNFSQAGAAASADNVYSYCTSIGPPPLNSNNYEYVVGGEVRQTWGTMTANDAIAVIQSAQTTDDVIQAFQELGSSYGWCLAANKMYGIASNITGNNVSFSSSLRNNVASAIRNTQSIGPSLYTQAANLDYGNGEYAAALYNTAYASVFSGATPVLSSNSSGIASAQLMYNKSVNGSYGVWPYEFSNEAYFYLNELSLVNGTAQSQYINSAYSSALLSYELSQENRQITGGFVANTTSATSAAQISAINNALRQIYLVLAIILVLLIIILLLLLSQVLGAKGKRSSRKGR